MVSCLSFWHPDAIWLLGVCAVPASWRYLSEGTYAAYIYIGLMWSQVVTPAVTLTALTVLGSLAGLLLVLVRMYVLGLHSTSALLVKDALLPNVLHVCLTRQALGAYSFPPLDTCITIVRLFVFAGYMYMYSPSYRTAEPSPLDLKPI
ncbi:hypothetical protein ElyMa_004533400 [Elysia marginata]|uniref:Uncharacterized protein n=1 Tax=Elysia marginata TaxID=1093978 RepID=A0AAV4HQJ3_9GAST|nr:hypothetical protein ElyMa_004533400 [Elysia marginata]